MKILIAGDFCPSSRTAKMIEENQFEEIFGDVKKIIESVDYSLVNLECPVVENSFAKPIPKCGPNLRCTRKAVEAICYAGFKGVTLANNHVLDYGEEGLRDTISVCNVYGLDTVGVGVNLKESSTILLKKINNVTIAFINCCEHEFSIATTAQPGSNPLNPVQQFYTIQEARKQADYVVLIVHGGHEHYQLPSPRMKELYRFFVDCGADAVINHHQHCFSGYEFYKGVPIVYGLGNFCFDDKNKRSSIWNEGYMVILSIEEDHIELDTIPYVQCDEKPSVVPTSIRTHFNSSIKALNDIISDDYMLQIKHEELVRKSTVYSTILSPYTGRLLRALCSRRILPSFMSKNRAIPLYNVIFCEAHRDNMLNYLRGFFIKDQ